MSATASHQHNPMSGHGSRVVPLGESGRAGSQLSAAPSELSLSMMRQAFGGLRANTERSLTSSTEQRGELERSDDGVSQIGRAPNSFIEETYSYQVAQESHTDISASAFEPGPSSAPISRIERTSSVEFFDYLTAIGGL
jgi:hypothetical protein